jgi:glutamate formiminotransferase / formiminotetrahydrofolate cyclodeaminase
MILVECVPNFSEGRDKNIINSITREIESVEGVRLLDVDPGQATNRTVVTFVGSLEGVKIAAFKAIRKASELIDMTKHKGAHPRMGATDVCPFIPVTGITMEECAEIAREVGKRVGDELKIPIYLYEAAASSPQRRNLADIREGEYEGFQEKINKPEWKPDFGPSKFNPRSGATVVGAREFLIAYNINLNTKDTKIASQIASSVREIGKPKKDERGKFVRDEQGNIVRIPGSLKAVKATGWYIDEYKVAQITMNLVDYKTTPPHIAFEEVRKEADKLGVMVTGSEIVGLIPKEAMLESGRYFLEKMGKTTGIPEDEIIFTAVKSMGLNDVSSFDPAKKIIENLIEDDSKSLVKMTVRGFVNELSTDSPAPGGGSTAALCGALSAALASMVASLTVSKKDYENVSDEMKQIGVKAQELKDELLKSVDRDTQAFNKIIDCFRLPKKTKEDKDKRKAAIEEATKHATLVPLSVLERAVGTLEVAKVVGEKGFKSSISDAGVAGACSLACAEGAFLNVMINLNQISDVNFVDEIRNKANKFKGRAVSLAKEIQEIIYRELKI